MEKRFFLAFFLTIALMFVYLKMAGTRTQPPIEASQQTEQQGVTEENPAPPSLIVPPKDVPAGKTVSIGPLDVTYCSTGGYIEKIYDRTYEQDLSFQNIGLVPSQQADVFTEKLEDNKLIFLGSNGLKKEFVFNNDRLQINIKAPLPPRELLLFSVVPEHNAMSQRYQEFFYWDKGFLRRKKFNTLVPQPSLLGRLFKGEPPQTEQTFSKVKYAGSRGRYFCFSLLEGEYDIRWQRDPATQAIGLYLLKPAGSVTLYLGLQAKDKLQQLGLQDIIHYGAFHSVGLIILKVLTFFFFLTHNWGVAVIMLGIFTYMILFPFTRKSTKAMKEMREFQENHAAEMKKLREKYKDNPHKMHQETMELYKKNNFSPLKGCTSGCLPMLVQLPIIWAFWAVVPRLVELKNAKFLWIQDLSSADKLFTLPVTLPLGIGNHVNILPILTAVLMFLQMKITNPPADPEQAQQQKMMGMIFPVMLIFFLYNLPSALLLYWFMQSVLTFFFQWHMMKGKAVVAK